MITRRAHHITHPIRRANIARVDPQTRRPCLSRFNGTLIMEMNIGDDRHRRLRGNLRQRRGAGFIRARDANDIRACFRRRINLRHGGGHIAG